MAVDLNYEKDSKERIPYEHYLEVYQNADPKEISSRCDVPYDAEKQEFTVSLMGVSYRISWPEYNVFHIGDDGSVSPIIGWYPLEKKPNAKILVLRYLTEGGAAPSTGKSGVKSPLPGVILDIKVNVGDTVKKGQTIIILEAMNSFMMERIQPVYKILPYELYFYGGALMNVFVMWEKNGKQETPEAIAKTLASGAVFTADTFPASCDGNR